MLELKPHRDFKKDVQRDKKSGGYGKSDFEILAKATNTLSACNTLDKKHLDHPLHGNWHGYRECHIKPDWLLVYKIDLDANTLNLARLGMHNQIFNR